MSVETANLKPLIAQQTLTAEELLSKIVGFSQVFPLVFDLGQKTLQYSEKQLRELLGYEPEEWNEKEFNLFEAIHPEDRDKFLQFLNSFPQSGNEIFPDKIRLSQKEEHYKSYHVFTEYQKDNTQVLIIISVRNMAGHDENEVKRLKRFRAEMIEELQRSNKDLEEFAYIASHDLQEPLRKISTFSGRLAEKFSGQLSTEGDLYIDRIMASAANMRNLIDNLLEFSRVSREKQAFAPLNLNLILHQVKNDLELSIEETGTRIMADSLPTVDSSFPQMKQLFNNIINNAIKFHKPGQPPVIEITAELLSKEKKQDLKLSEEKEYCKLEFCDNGIGFEEEYATKIFQIFQRLHGKSEFPGSGIGLAICKKIVDQHHGIIYAENRLDKGACFTIILPLKQTSLNPAPWTTTKQ